MSLISRHPFRRYRIHILHRYVLTQFLLNVLLCLLASTSLFLIFDFFERIGTFLKEGATLAQVGTYLLLKIPSICQLMTPISVLVSVVLTIGRLSQLSEITAMRACGASVLWLARPLFIAGFCISLLSFVLGETLVPWTSSTVDELYHIDIKKKAERGKYSRANFWYRSGNSFYEIGYYDSRSSEISGLTVFEFEDPGFQLVKRIDAKQAQWVNSTVGWTLKDIREIIFDGQGHTRESNFDKLPWVVNEKPADFYNVKVNPQSLSFRQLYYYIEKLGQEGVPVSDHLVDLASKISFPFVNLVVVLIAFPFALIPARSGSMTRSFIAAVSIGFGYYFLHAISTSLGSAELLPVLPSAWAANVVLGSIGGYFMAGAEKI